VNNIKIYFIFILKVYNYFLGKKPNYYDETKGSCYFMKVKEKVFVLFGLITATMSLASCSGSFSMKSLKKVELGVKQNKVEELLGEPDQKDGTSDEKWYYFEESFKSKSDDLIKLLASGKMDEANKLQAEMEKMSYKCTMIKFNDNKEVTEVFYDAKHKYDMDNDYATTSKQLSKVELSIADVQYYIDETGVESSTTILNVNDSLSYESSFNDGSYMHSYAKDVETDFRKESTTINWKDEICEYNKTLNTTKIGTFDRDGIFVWEQVKGDVVLPEGITSIPHEQFLNNGELTSIVIPHSVESIGEEAFKGCRKLTSITIPNSVTSIGAEAFENCRSLKNFVIEDGSSLAHIGSNAFKKTAIKFLSYDHGKYLPCGNDAQFALISLDNVSADVKIKTKPSVIADDAFKDYDGTICFERYGINCLQIDEGFQLVGCVDSSITNLVIPNFITKIESGAFSEYKALESISVTTNLMKNVTINDLGFTNLKRVNITSGTRIEPRSFKDCSSLTTVVIPNSVTSIGYWAFVDCSSLTSITIPSSVTTIEESAFSGCKSLNSIVIPSSVIDIGEDAFSNCKSLIIYCETASQPSGWDSDWNTSGRDDCIPVYWEVSQEDITCQNGLQFLIIGGNAVVAGHTNELPNDVVIPATITVNGLTYNVTSVGDKAFQDCDYLNSIEITNGITNIGNYAFEDCNSLKSIVIPSSVENIKNYAFNKCSSLTSIVLPNGVTSIGDYAFNECSALTSIELPSSLASIGYRAFNGCKLLTTTLIPNNVTSIGDLAFFGCDSLILYCEASNEPSGWDSSWDGGRPVYWGINENTYLVQDGIIYVKVDGKVVVTNCTNELAKDVTIPAKITINGTTSNVTCIGDMAFENCSSINSVVIPNGVTSIRESAFEGCKLLTSIVIPNSVETIGDYALNGCNSLQYNKYENCLFLGNAENPYLVLAKAKDTSITEVNISNDTKFIMNYAFLGCSFLTSIIIPNNVISIGRYAFDSIYSNSSLTIYCEVSSEPSEWDGWNSNGRPVYWGVTKEDIIHQNGIQYLIRNGDAVVTGHTSELPNDVVIPSSIVVEGKTYNVTSIGDNAFQNCKSLITMVIPDSVTSIGQYAFHLCSSLTSIVLPDNITSIENSTFKECSSLMSIEIPNSVISIGDGAFGNCSSLTSIVVPSSVTNIGYYVFVGCNSLTIYCEASSRPSGWNEGWNESWNNEDIPVYWAEQWSYVNEVPTPNK